MAYMVSSMIVEGFVEEWPRDEPLGWLRGRMNGFYRVYISLVLSFVYFPDCDAAEDQALNPKP
jgi:hypothetical protein